MTERTSTVYKRLYHYTNLQGLMGILDTQSLWATHYKFLNDRSELSLFRPRLSEFIYPNVLEKFKEISRELPDKKTLIEESGGFGFLATKETAHLTECLCDNIGDVYLVSFTGEHKDPCVDDHGLLSQWRAYGGDGGFAIVFDTEVMEELMGFEGKKYAHYGHLSDVVYSNDDEKYQEEFSDLLPHISGYVGKLMNSVIDGSSGPPSSGEAYHALISCISRYKHWGFQEEKEVRLVVLPPAKSRKHQHPDLVEDEGRKILPKKKVLFRQKGGEHVPYIQLFGFEDRKLPIRKIIVGPHKEQERRVSMLRTKLRHEDIEIFPSEIPYAG